MKNIRQHNRGTHYEAAYTDLQYQYVRTKCTGIVKRALVKARMYIFRASLLRFLKASVLIAFMPLACGFKKC